MNKYFIDSLLISIVSDPNRFYIFDEIKSILNALKHYSMLSDLFAVIRYIFFLSLLVGLWVQPTYFDLMWLHKNCKGFN